MADKLTLSTTFEGLQCAIESLKTDIRDIIPVKRTALVETLEELLRLRSEEQFITPKKRPSLLKGSTTQNLTGCGTMYVTVNYDDAGNIFEVFLSLGKAGGCASGQTNAMQALITIALRCSVHPEKIVEMLLGISCTESNNENMHSCSNAIAIVLKRAIDESANAENSLGGK